MIVAKAPPQPEQPHSEQRVLLRDISWETYQSLRLIEENHHLRMTYDRGLLEIMSPSRKHERVSHLIGLMIHEWTVLHDIGLESGGNTTFRREDLDRGLEPDHCYWIANEAKVRGKDEIDLSVDPPPDLALEVDVSHASVQKLPIYNALGVPEVWRWRHAMLEVLTLDNDGQYTPQKGSKALPRFPLRLVEDFLERRHMGNDTSLMKAFRKAIK